MRMPKGVDPPYGHPPEATPVDDVRAPRGDRFEERGVVSRVVLEIRVLDQNHIACDIREARGERAPFALVLLVVDTADLGMRLAQRGHDLAASVLRAVIDENDLHLERLLENATDDLFEGSLLVVDRNDDREFHGRERRTTRREPRPWR